MSTVDGITNGRSQSSGMRGRALKNILYQCRRLVRDRMNPLVDPTDFQGALPRSLSDGRRSGGAPPARLITQPLPSTVDMSNQRDPTELAPSAKGGTIGQP